MALRRADRSFERLEGHGAEIERKPFEGRVWSSRFGDSRASAGTVCIFGGPLAMGDLSTCEQASTVVEWR